jgi:hypothetical protein
MREKQRIIQTFGGRIDRFSIAECVLADGYKVTKYIFIVGELPGVIDSETLIHLINLIGEGYTLLIHYSEITNEQFELLDGYFTIHPVDETAFGLGSLKPGNLNATIGFIIGYGVLTITWPFRKMYQLGSWVMGND